MADAMMTIKDKVGKLEHEVQAAYTRAAAANAKTSEQAAVIKSLEKECGEHAKAILAKDERIAEEMSKRKQVERELAAVRAELDELGLG